MEFNNGVTIGKVAKFSGLNSTQINAYIAKGSIPAPTHLYDGIVSKRYTDSEAADVVKIVKSLQAARRLKYKK